MYMYMDRMVYTCTWKGVSTYVPLLCHFLQSRDHCVLQPPHEGGTLPDCRNAAYALVKVVYPVRRSSTTRKDLCCIRN